MAGKFVNSFLLGADPELVLLDPPTLINGEKIRGPQRTHYGFDHHGYVVEPHPFPSVSAREVVGNIKKSLDVISHNFPQYRLRSGAFYNDPSIRSVTLGGHVHIDLKLLSPEQITAMDTFAASLEGLDILPSEECKRRYATGEYGRNGDIRSEHGHVEYRSMCSWLFSRKTSMLCITGIKLAAVAPKTLKLMTSTKELKKWLEGFKGADDDVDWILDMGYFDTSMAARPDANVKSVWRVDPSKAETWIAEAKALQPASMELNMADMYRRMVNDDYHPTQAEEEEIRQRVLSGSARANTIYRAILNQRTHNQHNPFILNTLGQTDIDAIVNRTIQNLAENI